MYSRIFPIIFELAIPIPAAKAPTIGDKPNAAASAAAPKHEAVAAASIGPSDVPLESILIILGKMIAKNTVRANHSTRDVAITSMTPNVVIAFEDEINETITPKIARPKTSSTTAALTITRASIVLVFLSSCNTNDVIDMLVATSAAPTTKPTIVP